MQFHVYNTGHWQRCAPVFSMPSHLLPTVIQIQVMEIFQIKVN